jgi:UDP-4-amino-4-deoxy-L-arabinose formyltransferase/UDP-glucuronic acid dehydrogenase (UDP-4-keto-hexauronic acid decarboxylating)
MRAVLLAYHDVGCTGLEAVLKAGIDVPAVYTHRDDPAESVWFGSVADLARARRIPLHCPEEINAPGWVERIRRDRPDIVFSFYFRQLVCEEILSIPRLGAMNLHGSYLPRYRGRCPVNWVLIHGARSTGVTLHYMVRRADAGDIVSQRPIAIDFEDTALTLHRKVVREAALLLEEALPSIREGTHTRRPQDLAAGSYFGRRRPEDGRIDWTDSAVEIYNLVRAVTHPYPGAFTALDGRRLFIWEARPTPADGASSRPGRVETTEGLSVETACGVLRVLRCQLAGHVEMTGAEFVARFALSPGTRLGDSRTVVTIA